MNKLLFSCVALPFAFAAGAPILAYETGVPVAGASYVFVMLAEGPGTDIFLAGDPLPSSSNILAISLRAKGVLYRRASVQRVSIV